jgi:hypothetical protein
MNPERAVRTLVVLVVAGLAVACGKAGAPQPQAQPPFPYDQAPAAVEAPAVAEAPPVAQVVPTGRLWLDPLPTCDELQVSTLRWDAELLSKGVVELRFGEALDGPLFGRVGEAGEKVTGAWLAPGAVFVARLEDGTELARAVATGPDCEAK